MTTPAFTLPHTVRRAPSIAIRPRGVFTSAVGMVLIAATSLAVLSVRAQPRLRPALVQPTITDVEIASVADGYAVTGSIASLGAEEQTLTAGRWRVQGRLVPSGDNAESQAEPATSDAGADPCLADITADGHADLDDLLMVLEQWGSCRPSSCDAPAVACPADVDGDGLVSGCDLAAVLRTWWASP